MNFHEFLTNYNKGKQSDLLKKSCKFKICRTFWIGCVMSNIYRPWLLWGLPSKSCDQKIMFCLLYEHWTVSCIKTSCSKTWLSVNKNMNCLDASKTLFIVCRQKRLELDLYWSFVVHVSRRIMTSHRKYHPNV